VHYSYVSLTFCAEALHFLILRELKSPTEDGGAATPVSQYRPENTMTGALERLTPNSTPKNHYPSTNFKVLAPNLSVHGDSAINGQPEERDQRTTRSVPGDPMCSSSIGRVEKHHKHTGMLKQERGGHDRTCGELVTTSSHTAVFLTDLGEI
jgi:hypothetical protein